MYVTLGEAAKLTGKSKTSILRAIKDGRLSYAEKNEHSYKIDPAELFRVYPPVADSNLTKSNGTVQVNGTESNPITLIEVTALRERLQAVTEQLHQSKEHNADLKQERDRWQQQADYWRQQATGLLEDKQLRSRNPLRLLFGRKAVTP